MNGQRHAQLSAPRQVHACTTEPAWVRWVLLSLAFGVLFLFLVLPLATLRSVFSVANDWANDDPEATARVRGTAIKVPGVSLVWVLGWAVAGNAG